MKKTTKAVLLTTLGLIIWSTLMYIFLAFFKAELNPLSWSQEVRGALIFETFCYVCVSPLIVEYFKDEM